MSDHEPPAQQHQEPDYDGLLRSNLELVFNERNAVKRAAALAGLFVEEPILYEPDNIVTGRDAISAVAGKLLEQFGPGFRFAADGNALGHHGLASLHWTAGPADGAVVVRGFDVAEVVGNRISRL